MGDRSSGPDGPVPSDSGPNETTWVFSDPEPATQRLMPPASPPPPGSHPQTEATIPAPTEAAFPPASETVFPPPTEAAFPPPAEAVQHPPTEAVQPAPPTNFVRYGPGVPVTPEPRTGLTAEDIWRTGLVPAPAAPAAAAAGARVGGHRAAAGGRGRDSVPPVPPRAVRGDVGGDHAADPQRVQRGRDGHEFDQPRRGHGRLPRAV